MYKSKFVQYAEQIQGAVWGHAEMALKIMEEVDEYAKQGEFGNYIQYTALAEDAIGLWLTVSGQMYVGESTGINIEKQLCGPGEFIVEEEWGDGYEDNLCRFDENGTLIKIRTIKKY